MAGGRGARRGAALVGALFWVDSDSGEGGKLSEVKIDDRDRFR